MTIPKKLDLGKHCSGMMSFLKANLDDHKHGQERGYVKSERYACGFPVPPFQRDLVWSREQEVRFIESAWLGLPLGTFTYNYSGFTNNIPNEFNGWLIDGQQRLTTIERYWSDEFDVFGKRWSELEPKERRRFLFGTHFTHYESRLNDEGQIRQLYDLMAFGGVDHKESERAINPIPELLRVAEAMRDYIDDIPDEVANALPAMSGFDRDWADEVMTEAGGFVK